MDHSDVDSFQHGWEKLAKAKLRRWVANTVQSRRIGFTKSNVSDAKDPDSDNEDSEDEEDTTEAEATAPTFASMCMVNGQFIVDSVFLNCVQQALQSSGAPILTQF